MANGVINLNQGDIFNFPGNLGPIRGSALTIHHADWPAYPAGENFMEALLQFSAFPLGTKFMAIDDIDQALLFAADVKCGKLKEPFDERNFHIAVWHEDLIGLQAKGLIDGIKPLTERSGEKLKWSKLRSKYPEGIFSKDENGVPVPIAEPDFDQYENDEEFATFAVAPNGHIQISKAGRDFVDKLLTAENLDIGKAISGKVLSLFELKYYDTCIREACVQLEHEIKAMIKSELWGDKLTDGFIDYLRTTNKFLESAVRTYRQEMRSVFKLIRNDYMHNLSEVDEISARVILTRVARARSMLICLN